MSAHQDTAAASRRSARDRRVDGRWDHGAARGALGLTPGQLTAVGTVMALFVEDDLARGVSPWATEYCPACDAPRSLPGFVRYDGTSACAFVCNLCATDYEIARMQGLVSGIDDFVRGKTAGAAPSHYGQ